MDQVVLEIFYKTVFSEPFVHVCYKNTRKTSPPELKSLVLTEQEKVHEMECTIPTGRNNMFLLDVHHGRNNMFLLDVHHQIGFLDVLNILHFVA